MGGEKKTIHFQRVYLFGSAYDCGKSFFFCLCKLREKYLNLLSHFGIFKFFLLRFTTVEKFYSIFFLILLVFFL